MALKQDMQIDQVIGRCYVEDAWRLLERRIAHLKTETNGGRPKPQREPHS